MGERGKFHPVRQLQELLSQNMLSGEGRNTEADPSNKWDLGFQMTEIAHLAVCCGSNDCKFRAKL